GGGGGGSPFFLGRKKTFLILKPFFFIFISPRPGPPPPPENKNEENIKVSLGLSRFLGIFISFHLDVPATVRRVAMEMMDTHTSVTGDLIR
ncbi:MAG: hypothetical protein FWH21_09465, partial [Kiritimatiellaeota bacterium]|nr:hypothetical protein [Kiritimatiellota bacterium]